MDGESYWMNMIRISSIGGSVVECSPATRAARVRFPADATFSSPIVPAFSVFYVERMDGDPNRMNMICSQASVFQWCNARLPRGRPGFDSRPMQYFLLVCHDTLGFLLFKQAVSIVPWAFGVNCSTSKELLAKELSATQSPHTNPLNPLKASHIGINLFI
ncbi:unnamed protein product [Haemonchus placei]|uniref:Uncharacterized protein n=1 Tax=Haemonchus placei TaxID=6290 RepID=A0A0N4WL26_HAEPC|nr:unnamed protein product [Haemonchus placei]